MNRNSNIFIQENAFESVVCEMAAMLSFSPNYTLQECHMNTMVRQIAGNSNVCTAICSSVYQRTLQKSMLMALFQGNASVTKGQ